jgi:hypothetical protein
MSARTKILIGVIAAAALVRLVPHPPNFAPITAMALFGGAVFANRLLAFLVPLTAMFLTDLALEVTTRSHIYDGWLATGSGIHSGMWVIYATFAVIVLFGFLLHKHRSILSVTTATLISSLFFFLATNFGTWLNGDVGYPRTFAGLLECYTMALPFLHWTIAGDLFFSAVLFGGYALAERYLPAEAPASTLA